MLKLNDVTWLYQHLPMRFTLSVRRVSASRCLAQAAPEKHAAESDRRFSAAGQRRS
jgi:ABC-type thiamine transport system ATPase subunit